MRYLRRTTPGPDTSQYESIAADLARRLDQGEWREGARFPSRRVLAREYGVGQRTVRRALEILRERGRLLIRPRSSTRATLAASVHDMFDRALAVVMPGPVPATTDDFTGQMWSGVCLGAREARCPLIVLQHPNRWRTHFAAGLRHLPVAGVILQGPFKPLLTQQYEELDKPVVLLDQPLEGTRLGCVCVDNYAAAFDATTRMIELGHERIAFIQPVVSSIQRIDPDGSERKAGFLAACQAARLPHGNVRVLTAYRRETSVYEKVFQKDLQFSALLCAAEAHAQVIHTFAAARGYRIPRDLSLVTFRSTHPASDLFSGPAIDFAAMGRLAVTEILNFGPQPATRRMPARWMEGSTLGAPPVRRAQAQRQ